MEKTKQFKIKLKFKLNKNEKNDKIKYKSCSSLQHS